MALAAGARAWPWGGGWVRPIPLLGGAAQKPKPVISPVMLGVPMPVASS